MAEKRIVEIEQNQKLCNLHNLPERQRQAYWILVETIVQMESNSQLPLESGAELLNVWCALEYDHPELALIWKYEKSMFSMSKRNGKSMMTVHMVYKGTRKEIENRIAKVEKKAKEIIEKSLASKQQSDQEMTWAICRYLVDHFHYSSSIGTEKDGEKKYPAYSYSLECILKGDGVCAGLSCCLTYLLRKLQIPVVTVLGDAHVGDGFGCHAWNIVQYADGTHRHIDVTWDLGTKETFMKHRDLDDVAMRMRRHLWEAAEYPCCV